MITYIRTSIRIYLRTAIKADNRRLIKHLVQAGTLYPASRNPHTFHERQDRVRVLKPLIHERSNEQ